MNRASRRRRTGVPLCTMGRSWSSRRTSDRPKYWTRRASWGAGSAWKSRGIRWRRAAWEWKGLWRWKLTTIFRMSRWCRWRTRLWAQANAVGGIVKDGYGGGIPVVAFWTSSVGEAIGHIETLPWTLSIPVKVEADGRGKAGGTVPGTTALKPGESYG